MTYVKFNNVGLKFQLYKDKGITLKETLINLFKKRNYYKNSDFWALKDMSFEISSGQRVGIIGNNGAGKSSLLKLLTKIYEPTTGEIVCQGKVAPLIELGAGFNPELSGYENIFLNGAIMGKSKKEMQKLADNIIKFAELEEFIHTPIKYYSTGMYMRLAFTIATEISPEILIIDELFAGGDINFIDKAKARLDKIIDESQIVIMVSHSLDLVQKLCNRVILVEKGRILLDGEPKEVCDYYINLNKPV
ncbi:ABC transporter ATP-binding protein [Paenibacillus qinlingensis]|uniref:ABC-type polysaccharide/polyol phosphate transport system ATPase subunit n=1 Tax=Paenibacillus qinlingensis TaxID=1837343 RepID=A0ABU1NXK9_9BACL|nr:ABC transporter ATP-binding protein [Paenibacillus qinlingensis]MDR6552203.1 ABC-type polysaccharide/polyol phosphate transport system ATPase subunit [Paenibacillus qinlingensis]